MSELEGKVALVTGGSRGLGEFIAEGLLKAGAKVYVTSRKAAACDATAAELSRFGECISLPSDLATMPGVEGLVASVTERETKLDILVNNAGATWGAPARRLSRGRLGPGDGPERQVGLLPDAEAAAVAARGRDAGVAVSRREHRLDRRHTHAGGGQAFSYTVSKAAVHHLTRGLSARLAHENILVNAIAPGPFETKMMEFALKDPETKGRIEAGIPLGRIGYASDIAGVALFLCGPASAYVAGAVIPLDGGAAAAR